MQPTRVIPRGMDPSVPRVRASPDFEFFASFFFLLEGFAVKLKFEEEKEKKVTRFYIVKVEINHFWEDRKKNIVNLLLKYKCM